MRITSLRSNGFASTSYAPMFRASAHRCSSASGEVTIRNGGLGKRANCVSISCHVPGARANDNWNSARPQDSQRRCKCATPVNRPFGIGAEGPFGMIHKVLQKNVVLFNRTDRENDNIAARLGLDSGRFFHGAVVG